MTVCCCSDCGNSEYPSVIGRSELSGRSVDVKEIGQILWAGARDRVEAGAREFVLDTSADR